MSICGICGEKEKEKDLLSCMWGDVTNESVSSASVLDV